MASVNGSNQDPASAATSAVPERQADWVWGPNYLAAYDFEAAAKRGERLKRRERARAAGKTPDANMITRLSSTRSMVDMRLATGFRWEGGYVGGNEAYPVPALRSLDLVSNQHPVLKCFVSKTRRAKHLRVGDTKAESYTTDSKLLALDAAYVEANSACCGVLRQELDVVLSVADIEACCRRTGVPLPNLVVGWTDTDGHYHRPHLLWLLHDSVPLVARDRGEKTKDVSRFGGLYRGAMRGLCRALISIGADPGGLSNAHRHKNPLCPLWSRSILAEQPYDLQVLANAVDPRITMKDLVRMAAEVRGGGVAAPVADHPDEVVAARSNSVFRALTSWARAEVALVRAAGGDKAEFTVAVEAEAGRVISEAVGDTRRTDAATVALAARVSKWTWQVYRAPVAKPKLTDEEVRLKRADGGRAVAAGRRARSEDAVVEAAVRLRREGVEPTQTLVVSSLAMQGARVSRATVERRWKLVREALATPSNAPPSVKKDPLTSAGRSEAETEVVLSPVEVLGSRAGVRRQAEGLPRVPAFLGVDRRTDQPPAFLSSPFQAAMPAPAVSSDPIPGAIRYAMLSTGTATPPELAAILRESVGLVEFVMREMGLWPDQRAA